MSSLIVDDLVVRERLQAQHLPALLERLELRPDDAAEMTAAVDALLESPDDVAAVAEAASRLADGVGIADEGPDPWENLPSGREDIALAALLVAVPEVRAEHERRGIAQDLSWHSLADLGQQMAVNRIVHGRFGLDTYGWMRTAWSGKFLWVGRLQLVVDKTRTGWVLDTHIPRTGPLTPEAVDDSFTRAAQLFATHFPDMPATSITCTSWLLDPTLATVLPDTNLARFQQRWTLAGSGYQADSAVVYFVFDRRVEDDELPDLDTLPRRTSLERAVLDHLGAGNHWRSWSGRAPLPS